MLISSTRDRLSRSSISRFIRCGLLGHDGEKARLRRRVVGGRAAQGLDEADQAGERGAQLVAGIGDEIGAHPLDRALARAVGQDRQQAAARDAVERQHGDVQLARDRDGEVQLDELVLTAPKRAVDAVAKAGMAEQGGHAGAERRARRRVEAQDAAIGAEQDGRVRKPFKDRLLGRELLAEGAHCRSREWTWLSAWACRSSARVARR